MKKRAHLVIEGRVQGVCFRMYTRETAERLGLTGWVKNRPDGDVEVLAEGEDAALAEFVLWCRKGPSHAQVTHVSETFSQATGEFRQFTVTY